MGLAVIGGLPGISGSLLPNRYLEAGVGDALTDRPLPPSAERALRAWWRRVEADCGPASSVRSLFDIAAMPLFALLGFRARDACIGRDVVHAQLETRHGVSVALAVLPWARRAPSAWRSVAAHGAGAHWAFVLSPPFLSIVDLRGRASRHSVDLAFPAALDDRSIDRLWLLAEARAFESADATPASPFSRLVSAAARFQDAVRADLQTGVLDALTALTPEIARRRQPRESAGFHEALTLVYRMLFLLFAESRDLVPRSHSVYGRAYSIGTLCRLAVRGGRDVAGLWEALAAITRLSRTGCRADDLIVRPFNGQLFARASAPSLEAGRESRYRPAARPRHEDNALARALTALGTRRGQAGHEEIAYADLGVEQLGAVYERVLDVNPCSPATHAKALPHGRHSAQRKQSGTFYTPQPLAEYIVRRTLAPLVAGATSDQILHLRVVDPSMGSGAFLVAACRYLTTAYERALIAEGRCAETDLDDRVHADHRRSIAERCVAGVDLNPIAVQLARLSLWLTTLSKGKPLSFLDHRLRVGNSLIGASPDDLWRTSSARVSQPVPVVELPLFDALGLEDTMRIATERVLDLLRTPDATVADIKSKEALWAELSGGRSPLGSWRVACSLWCARWVWANQPTPVGLTAPSDQELRAALDAILRRDRQIDTAHLQRWLSTSERIASSLSFFHWPLEFPDVFFSADGGVRPSPGFDAVIGNPPWEMLRQDDRADAPASDRSADLTFVRRSGLYRRCGRGHVNLYQPFVERCLSIARAGGRVGLVLPWSFAVDDGTAELRREVLDRCRIDAIVGLDNAVGMFPIHRGLRFAAVTLTKSPPSSATIRARFGVRGADEIDALPDIDDGDDARTWMRLDRIFLTTVGGPARRIPDIRRPTDVSWLRRLFTELPALGDARGWQAAFGRELNATDDRRWFGATGLPVLDGKHILPFMADVAASRRRIQPDDAARQLPHRRYTRARLGYRDVSGVGNRLSLIAAMLPPGVVTTHTIFCLRSQIAVERQHFLCALFNSFVLNAIVRMLMGSHVTTSLVSSLPVPVWTGDALQRRVAALAASLADQNKASNAAELQALVCVLYGLDAATFASILDTFPLVPPAERRAALEALPMAIGAI